MANIFSEIRNHHNLKMWLKIRMIYFSCHFWVFFFTLMINTKLVKKSIPSWIIGPSDVAGYANRIARYIENSKTLVFVENKFSGASTSFSTIGSSQISTMYFELLKRPMIIGKLIAMESSFVYLGFNSYIFDCYCVRKAEFSLIRRAGGKIICVFLGSEIRSPLLSDEFSKAIRQDVLTTYLFDGPQGKFMKMQMEARAKSLAGSADAFAQLILNSPVDQISYLKSKTQPIFYFLPSGPFTVKRQKSRFTTGKIKIVHAPTSRLAKGTALVRSVIKKLLLEGWEFEYVELFDVEPEQVFSQLEDADIVLNEFYSFLPGMLGIEAMYFKCALLTSADKNIEKWLPNGAENAWFKTRYWELEENLRILLSDHERINDLSLNGHAWVVENYDDYSNVQRLNSYLRNL
ncbi:Glycosyl transferases group 1 [Candidatus Nanopelagicaceae bacterium]